MAQLPDLEGSPWDRRKAERIRLRLVRRLRYWLAPNAAAEQAKALCLLVTDARFWIRAERDAARDLAAKAWRLHHEGSNPLSDDIRRRNGGE